MEFTKSLTSIRSRRLRTFWARLALTMAIACLMRQAWGLQYSANNAESLPTTQAVAVSPTFLEQSKDPLSPQGSNGYQVGGLNTRYNAGQGQQTLQLAGGLYFSHAAAGGPFSGAPSPTANGQIPGLPAAWLQADPSRQQASTGQITYQKINYSTHGLQLSGSYANVGKDFQGRDALVQQLKSAQDQDADKLLVLGERQMNVAASYNGIKRLAFTSALNTTQNNQQGGQNGMTCATQTNSVSVQLDRSRRLNYSLSNQVQNWNPAIAQNARQAVTTQQIALSGGLARNSTFSIGQTQTGSQTGQQQTDVLQRDLVLQWHEWKHLALNGAYMMKRTEQSQTDNNVLRLDLDAQLTPHARLTGRLVTDATMQPGQAGPAERDLVDMTFDTSLRKNVHLVSQYTNSTDPNNGTVLNLKQQMDWTINAAWALRAGYTDTRSAQNGDITRAEIRLTGKVGNKSRPDTWEFFTREDGLANIGRLQRDEVGYTHQFGSAKIPMALQTKGGTYTVTQPNQHTSSILLIEQFMVQPTKQLKWSVGVYDGPMLGGCYLQYRSWGNKPQGNLDSWTANDLKRYREIGGELMYQPAGNTMLAADLFHAQAENGGQGSGLAGMLAFNRTINADDTLTLKVQWCAQAICASMARPQVDAAYRHLF